MYQVAVIAVVLITSWKGTKLARLTRLDRLNLTATSVALLYAVAAVTVVVNSNSRLRQVESLQNDLRDAQITDDAFTSLVRPGMLAGVRDCAAWASSSQ